jgi:hypothetical protein
VNHHSTLAPPTLAALASASSSSSSSSSNLDGKGGMTTGGSGNINASKLPSPLGASPSDDCTDLLPWPLPTIINPNDAVLIGTHFHRHRLIVVMMSLPCYYLY